MTRNHHSQQEKYFALHFSFSGPDPPLNPRPLGVSQNDHRELERTIWAVCGRNPRPQFHEKTPERESKSESGAGEEKKTEILGLHPRAPRPKAALGFGPPPFGPPPLRRPWRPGRAEKQLRTTLTPSPSPLFPSPPLPPPPPGSDRLRERCFFSVLHNDG